MCPHCGSSHAHRTKRTTPADRALGLAGARLYRCTDCGMKHHGFKWLKLIAPDPVGVIPRMRRQKGSWKERYFSWRLREGRQAHRIISFVLVILASVCGFFLALWNSAVLFAR